MAHPITRTYIDTFCANCNKSLHRPVTNKKRAFCNQICYFQWLREKRPASEIRFLHERGAMLAELQRVANLLGRLPMYDEMKELGEIYPSIYSKRFGSFGMALSCISNPAPHDDWSIDSMTPEDAGWLVGVADSESTFRLAKHGYAYTPIWGLQLRADDLFMIKEVRRILGLENRTLTYWTRDNDRKRGINAGDAVRFYIRDVPTHITRTVPFFTRFPLRSKKKLEFPLFAESIQLLNKHRHSFKKEYPIEMRHRMEAIKLELEQLKKYHPITD